jgi:hypothetical protein
MAQKRVTLVHKDLPDQSITVTETAARVHKQNGWKDAPKSQQPSEPEKSKN